MMEMLTFSIDGTSAIPIYRQLYEYIKEEIRAGRIEYNTRLPSKRRLSAYLDISLNTIQGAYDQLIEEGYIVSRPKKGFYVCHIENILNINLESVVNREEAINSSVELEYDFSYHGIDHDSFPFAIWRRLTREVINEYDKELLQLGESQGRRELRTSIAKYLRHSRGVDCSPENIVISSGTECLFQILIQLLGQNYVYGIENPGYEKLNLLFSSNNARFEPIDIDMNGMKMEDVEKSHVDILCITPAHQFPSGGIMPIDRRIKLLNWAYKKPERYIIEDDYDSEFKYSGKPILALRGLDTYGKVIYMGSLSKSLSPSIRVSYMVLPDQLMKQYCESLSFIVCPVPTIDQKILQRFIEDGHFERHINRMRNIYRKKREVIVNELAGMRGKIEIIGADAGLHLILKVNNGMTEKELVEKGISVGVGVYGTSKYYYVQDALREMPPTVLLGYAGMSEIAISTALRRLVRVWFP